MGDPTRPESADTAPTLAQRGPGGVLGRRRAVQRMRGAPPARATSRGLCAGDPPFGGLIPRGFVADAGNTRGHGAPTRREPPRLQSVFRLPRGAMNYSIRNLVIAGGLAIAAIVAVLIYTSNVQNAAKEGQARVTV